jgi:hypothetical protein
VSGFPWNEEGTPSDGETLIWVFVPFVASASLAGATFPQPRGRVLAEVIPSINFERSRETCLAFVPLPDRDQVQEEGDDQRRDA